MATLATLSVASIFSFVACLSQRVCLNTANHRKSLLRPQINVWRPQINIPRPQNTADHNLNTAKHHKSALEDRKLPQIIPGRPQITANHSWKTTNQCWKTANHCPKTTEHMFVHCINVVCLYYCNCECVCHVMYQLSNWIDFDSISKTTCGLGNRFQISGFRWLQSPKTTDGRKQCRIKVVGGPRLDTIMGPSYIPSSVLPSFPYLHRKCDGTPAYHSPPAENVKL